MRRLLLVLVATVTMWAQGASAAIIVSLDVIDDGVINPGLFTWIYRAVLEPEQTMEVDDFFTIYDFPGLDPAQLSFSKSVSPAVSNSTFTPSVQLVGFDPPDTNLFDHDQVTNVTVRLTAGDTVDPANDPGPGPVLLGLLFVKSAFGDSFRPELDNYGAAAHSVGPVSNTGSVPVAVPEPSSVLLMIVGLIAIGALSFRRREGGL